MPNGRNGNGRNGKRRNGNGTAKQQLSGNGKKRNGNGKKEAPFPGDKGYKRVPGVIPSPMSGKGPHDKMIRNPYIQGTLAGLMRGTQVPKRA